jgi:diadenosine tetraphosphate (Ap4A) HIT family hydrolase
MSQTKLKDCPPRIESFMGQCLFCSVVDRHDREIIGENRLLVAVPDHYPVSQGHTLLIPKRHITTLIELTPDEMLALGEILKVVQKRLNNEFTPDGYNIGVNEGEAAGQTIPHLHVHVIPRYAGDVEEPRGGIRNIKKALVSY